MNATSDSVLPFTKLVTSAHVQVWIANLDQPQHRLDELAATLDAAERERASRLTNDERRRRFVAGRGILRELLGASTNTAPAKVRLTYGSHGKPELADDVHKEVHFNLSHSVDRAVYAVALGRRVGVDIEHVRPMSSLKRVTRSFFSPSENARLQALPDDARMTAFFRCWTRKEALGKARGDGVSDYFRRLDVVSMPHEDTRRRNIDGWDLEDLVVPGGHVAAVAVEAHA